MSKPTEHTFFSCDAGVTCVFTLSQEQVAKDIPPPTAGIESKAFHAIKRGKRQFPQETDSPSPPACMGSNELQRGKRHFAEKPKVCSFCSRQEPKVRYFYDSKKNCICPKLTIP